MQATTDYWSPEGWLMSAPPSRSHRVHSQGGGNSLPCSYIQHAPDAQASHQFYPSLSLSLLQERSSMSRTKPDAETPMSLSEDVAETDCTLPDYSRQSKTQRGSNFPCHDCSLTAADAGPPVLQHSTGSQSEESARHSHQALSVVQSSGAPQTACGTPVTSTTGRAAQRDEDVTVSELPSASHLLQSCGSANVSPAYANASATANANAKSDADADEGTAAAARGGLPRPAAEHLKQNQSSAQQPHATNGTAHWQPPERASESKSGQHAVRGQHQQQESRSKELIGRPSSADAHGIATQATDRRLEAAETAVTGQQQHASSSRASAAVADVHQAEAPAMHPMMRAPGAAETSVQNEYHQQSSRSEETVDADAVEAQQVPAQGAAAMAAWLLQQPELLQDVLDQLESFAAQGGAYPSQHAMHG